MGATPLAAASSGSEIVATLLCAFWRLEYKVQKKHETEQIQDRHLSNTFS
jgi:hypothetical protein